VYRSETHPLLVHASKALARVLPNATLRELPGQSHNVASDAIAPVLADFVAGPGAERETPVTAG
jgi:hypothetical protein